LAAKEGEEKERESEEEKRFHEQRTQKKYRNFRRKYIVPRTMWHLLGGEIALALFLTS